MRSNHINPECNTFYIDNWPGFFVKIDVLKKQLKENSGNHSSLKPKKTLICNMQTSLYSSFFSKYFK